MPDPWQGFNRQDNLRTSDQTFDGVQSLDDLALSYTYAADKQITAETIIGDAVQNTSFTAQYDAGNRITAWQMPLASASTSNQTWNYDDAGNWNSTTKTIAGNNTTENRNHSVSDQITSIAGNAAVHDLKGNLTEYEINSKQYEVTYDLDNRIIKVDVNNTDVEYRYDALGRRTIRKEGSTKTALLWWGNSECAEYVHGAGQATIQNDIMSHPAGLNAVIARAVDGSKFDLEWYHKNYLDHVYAVSDDSGNLTEHYRYTAFGEVTIYNGSGAVQSATQINNQITWNTRRLDEVSGYYLYKYRHYDPALGRWPSRDPIEEEGGVNLYTYVENNTINDWDYLGMITYPNGNIPYEFEINGKSPTGRAYFDTALDLKKCTFSVDIPLRFKAKLPAGYTRKKLGEDLYKKAKENLKKVKEQLDSGELQKAFKKGVTDTWDQKFRLCCVCDDCPNGLLVHVNISESKDPSSSYPVHVYSLLGGNNSNQDSWNLANGTSNVAAHEIGHFLGNIDEYGNIGGVRWNNGNGEYKGAEGNKNYGKPEQKGGNIMNNSHGAALPIHMWYVIERANGSSGLSKCSVVKANESCNKVVPGGN